MENSENCSYENEIYEQFFATLLTIRSIIKQKVIFL